MTVRQNVVARNMVNATLQQPYLRFVHLLELCSRRSYLLDMPNVYGNLISLIDPFVGARSLCRDRPSSTNPVDAQITVHGKPTTSRPLIRSERGTILIQDTDLVPTGPDRP